jgi:hypothetical protein
MLLEFDSGVSNVEPTENVVFVHLPMLIDRVHSVEVPTLSVAVNPNHRARLGFTHSKPSTSTWNTAVYRTEGTIISPS